MGGSDDRTPDTTVTNEQLEVEKLTDELFGLVEKHQGYFHVSDGETFPTKDQFFTRIRGRLHHGQTAVDLMREFLARHGELSIRAGT